MRNKKKLIEADIAALHMKRSGEFTQFFLFLRFFFLDEKEPKNQAKTPNPFLFAQKAFASPPEKLGFRTVLAKPTTLLPMYTLTFTPRGERGCIFL